MSALLNRCALGISLLSHWEYRLFHAARHFPCSLSAWKAGSHTVRVTNGKRKGHGRCPWTMDDEGPLLEATVGGSEVMGSFWRAEREAKALGGQGTTVIAVY